jgi:hypothetical protein
MNKSEIQTSRLFSQNIIHSVYSEPAGLVHWLCGIQAQDYINAKWGIGVRIPSMTDDLVEKAIADQSIIRTWLFRGTLHFVSAIDLHWLLELLAKRILLAGAPRNRQLGLDEKILQFSLKLLYKKLKDGKAHSREEINDFLNLNGIITPGNVLSHILQYSALNGQICFGPKKGNEFTFVLLDKSMTRGEQKTREEALFELAMCYFSSHGPATIKDFIWWSGLTIKDARTAVEMAKHKLISDVYEANEYWLCDNTRKASKKTKLHLLPAFDSYLLAYRDRSIFLDDLNTSKVISSNGIFRPIILYDGKIVGIWKRSISKDKLIVETNFFIPPKPSVSEEVLKSANKYATYLKKDLGHISIDDKIV